LASEAWHCGSCRARANRIECADTAIDERDHFSLGVQAFEDCHLATLPQELPGQLLSRQCIWIVETWTVGSRLTSFDFSERQP
jgi:hypothetical protein